MEIVMHEKTKQKHKQTKKKLTNTQDDAVSADYKYT